MNKHRFLPIGGDLSGHRKWSESPYGYYSTVFMPSITDATKTEKKYRYKFAIQLMKYSQCKQLNRWNPILIHLQHAYDYSYLISNTEVLYIKFGRIILGKVYITLIDIKGKLKIQYIYKIKEDYRRYKATNNLKHNYASYHNATGEYDYQTVKDRNRELHKRKMTK